jgi:hypothetical protein
MDRRSFLGLGTVVAGATLVGCGPSWQVIVQAAPSPFLGQRRFAVQPIDFSGLHVGSKPEPVYLSEKDPKQQASFAEDKAALNDRFLEQLRVTAAEAGVEVVPATGPGDAPFTIRPAVPFLEPGFYVGVAAASSHVEMNVRIVAPDGRILDEVAFAHGTSPNSGVAIRGFAIPKNPSSGGRLRSDGEGLGKLVGLYLQARVVGRG